jgi:hypothetical protein
MTVRQSIRNLLVLASLSELLVMRANTVRNARVGWKHGVDCIDEFLYDYWSDFAEEEGYA